MIFSVIVLCTIDRAIIWICANTAMIWPRWFISHFVSHALSHMLLLSRLFRQDLRVNSPKTTYCTSRSKLILGLIVIVSRSVSLALVLLRNRRYISWQTCSFLYRIIQRDLLSRIAGISCPWILSFCNRWLPNVVLPLACLLSLSTIFSKCIYFR